MTMRVRHASGGFTLIEVMIVVAIVAILAAIAYPSYVSQINKGRRAECRSGIMQSMQQQERYYSQYNVYVVFARGAATAKTKSFSGESPAASSCQLQALACTAPSSTDLARCIELRAFPTMPDSSIDYFYLDSDGNRGCQDSSGRTTTNKTCWP